MEDNGFAMGYAMGNDSNKCCNNGGMWGDGGYIWLIFILAILFGFGGFGGNGWGGNGFNGAAGQGALTRADLCQDMNFQNLDNAVRSGVAESNSNFRTIDNAVCTLGYQTAQLANGIQMQVGDGFSRLDTSLCQLGNNIAQTQNALQAQIADCCCQNRYDALQNSYATQSMIQANTTQGIMNTTAIQNQMQQLGCASERMNLESRFAAQQDTCATLQAIDKVGDRIIDYMSAQQNQALRDENQALRLQASQAAQNTYLVNQLRPCPVPAYPACPPTGYSVPGYYYGYNNSGCNSSCCGCNG